MVSPFHACVELTQRLHAEVVELQGACGLLQLAPLEEREWFQLLRQKLLSQLKDDAFLVAAVVGGTNIGKSVIFNHLAGCRASATSPLASGTKHPVCLVPPGFRGRHDLDAIFDGFTLREWSSSDESLTECEEHQLFWRTSDELAENLLVLDTPDIDSDARINWERADTIRRCADVLIAVLTQQKYNDAAVKQFFRKAADEDKAVIIVFNQCLLPDDEAYWPLWLETFCGETGIDPEFVYIAPNDRQAAEENRLGFYERQRVPGENVAEGTEVSRDLSRDLSRLRFGDVKLRSLRGALRHLIDPQSGVPEYLREVSQRSERFLSAGELLSAEKLARLDGWPLIPNSVLVETVRQWWQGQREGWSAAVHGFYNHVGEVVAWPFRAAGQQWRGEPVPPLEAYRRQEWTALLSAVEQAYDRLQILSDSGNPLLTARLEELLGGVSRSKLLKQLETAQAGIDLDAELEELVRTEMQSFQEESPKFYRVLKRIDQSAAVARPMTSVALFVTGFGPMGDAATQLATDTVIQSAVHFAGDVAGGTVAATVGETALSKTTASSAGYVEAKFHKLQSTFAERRVEWLLKMLKEHLWGSLLDDLQSGATVRQSEAYRHVETTLNQLTEQLRAQEQSRV